MGYRLAQALTAPVWAPLSAGAYRVANALAWAVRDSSSSTVEARTFWAGHAHLAKLVFGHDDVTTFELKQIQRAVRELREAGAIQVVRPAARGVAPVYRVTLDAPLLPVESDHQEGPKNYPPNPR